MSKETFEERLRRRAAENRQKFNGLYAVQLAELQGLSASQLNSIAPAATDKEAYEELIVVVQEASARNDSQAELKQKVLALGEVAVTVAKKVPSLAAILL